MVDGQAPILQVHRGADVHGVRQEGRRGHNAARVLHGRQRLHVPHSSRSPQNTALQEMPLSGAMLSIAKETQVVQCAAYALPIMLCKVRH